MAQVVRWIDSQEQERVDASARRERRGGGAQRVRGDRALGRPNQRQRLRDRRRRCSTPTPTPACSRPRCQSELRAERLLDGGWHTAYLCAPAHEQRRLQPLFATLVQEIVAHAYDRTTETGTAARPAAAARARRVREHRAAPRPRDARLDRRRTGHPARLGLPGHGADQRRLRARPRADDRLEPPREGDPLGHRGPSDARLRRPAARRRGGPAHVVDLEHARPLHDGVDSASATSRRRTCCARCSRATASSSTATSRRRGSRCAPGSRIAGSADSQGIPSSVAEAALP